MLRSDVELRDVLLADVRKELDPYPFHWTADNTCRIGRARSPVGRKLFIDILPVADIHRSWGERQWEPGMAMAPESSFQEFTLEAEKVKRAHWLHENKWWHVLIVVWPGPEAGTAHQGWMHNPLGWNRGLEIPQKGADGPALRFVVGQGTGRGAGFFARGFNRKIEWEWEGMWDGWSYKRIDGLWGSVGGDL